MKTLSKLIIVASVLFASSGAYAETPHGHEHSAAGGPKGGRLLENTKPHAEFFIEKDKTVTMAFYDEELKPVPAAEQNVLVTAEQNGVKTKLEFEKKGEVLVSKGKLPEGDAPKIVVQFRQAPDAKPSNFRFTANEEVCGECKRAEYACICAH